MATKSHLLMSVCISHLRVSLKNSFVRYIVRRAAAYLLYKNRYSHCKNELSIKKHMHINFIFCITPYYQVKELKFILSHSACERELWLCYIHSQIMKTYTHRLWKHAYTDYENIHTDYENIHTDYENIHTQIMKTYTQIMKTYTHRLGKHTHTDYVNIHTHTYIYTLILLIR